MTLKNRICELRNALLDIKLKSSLYVLLGSFILAFGMYNIHAFSEITEGGGLGLTLLLFNCFDISPAVSGFILNVLCYAIGYSVMGAGFIVYSLIAGGSFSVFYAVCELFPPVYPNIASFPLAAAIIGAVFVGVGVGLCVRVGSAPTGDDAIAMSASRRFGIGIQWVYLIFDLIVLLLSLVYIPLAKILYSLITVVLSGQIVGFVESFGRKKPA